MAIPNFNDSFGWENNAFTEDIHVVISEYILIFTLLICLSLIIQYYIGHIYKLKYLSESGGVLILGLIFGAIMNATFHSLNKNELFDPTFIEFNHRVFYFILLPPILFNSGYHLKRKLFYMNIDGILILSILGTLISTTIIAFGLYIIKYYNIYNHNLSFIEMVTFASLISSTDPVSSLTLLNNLKVDPTLFYIIFGESIMNDSIVIIIFKTTSKYIGYSMTNYDIFVCIINFSIVFIGSSFIGYSFGILLAMIFHKLSFPKAIGNTTFICIPLFLLSIYIPFLLSEILQLSGIVSILFTGISARKYMNKTINKSHRIDISFLCHLLANIAETASFCLLGISIFLQLYQYFQWKLILWTLFLCQLGRLLHVYPLLSMVSIYCI